MWPKLKEFIQWLPKGTPRPLLRPLTRELTPPGGPLLRTLACHSGSVTAVAVTPDGKQAASASWHKALKAGLRNGSLAATFTCHGAALWYASAGNGTIVAGDTLGQVHSLYIELGDDS